MLNPAEPHARLKHLPYGLRLSAYGAAASLYVEQVLFGLSAPLMALVTYMAVGMTGVMALMPGGARVALFAALLLWLAMRIISISRDIRKADLQQRLRRLEQASQLPAGSLLLLVDSPSDGQPDAPLWQRAMAQVPNVQALPWPRPSKLIQDRFGLAPLLILLLCAALFIGSRNSWNNLQNSVSPWPTTLADVQISAVVRPPPYTDLPPQPLNLRGGGSAEISAIHGSDILMTVVGVQGNLTLGNVPFVRQGAGNSRAAVVHFKKSGRYRLKNGWRTIASLDVRLRTDGAPQLFFSQEPKITSSQSLEVNYRFVDDYGLKYVALVATDGRTAEAQMLPKPQGTDGIAHAWRDFTPSRFAGKSVQLVLVGIDAQGNKGISAPLAFLLPEHMFKHPVAQQIIGVRKGLFEPEPNFRGLANSLDLIARRLNSYDGNLTVFAALRMVRYRVLRPEASTQVGSSAGILWQTALDLDGAGNRAALREAFEAVQRAIHDGKDIRAALAALQQQMAQHLDQNAQNMSPGGSANTQMFGQEDIAQRLQDMQAQLAAGDSASAEAMLQQLQHLMEQLQNGSFGSAEAQAAQRTLQNLRGIAARQQGVMNETAATNITGAIVGADQLQKDLQNLQQDQQRLRAQLRDLKRDSKMSASKAMSEAETGMQESVSNLRSGASRQALVAQGRAMNGLSNAMAALQQQANGKGARSGRRSLFDPLGRYNGGNLGPEYKIPAAGQRQQVQEIRRLLQERAADPGRSAAERAYILRLLKQF
jgi:Domain of unknown function (DUF4175)